MIELHNMDCMELMQRYPDNYFDLAIVDPPYGIDAGSMRLGTGKILQKKNWDERAPSIAYFKNLFRVSKNQIIWGGNYFAHSLPITGAWLYWDKMTDGFAKSFSTGELAWTSIGNTMKQIRYKWQGNYIGFEGSISTKTASGIEKIHPTQKPIALYRWLLDNYAKQGDKILDTHLGSGSSAIAAYQLGYDFVGCELDKDYFQAMQKRVRQAMKQTNLFQSVEEKQAEQIKIF